jgi:hypothetical protein
MKLRALVVMISAPLNFRQTCQPRSACGQVAVATDRLLTACPTLFLKLNELHGSYFGMSVAQL